ncbi:DNA repair protein recA homolog 3, mitochondrial isoform X2 [Amaranthus tricolor]|uniref:DNA repair protein recA homolog 3, mitochondrial isoform X2 n=1 Tax=Amaranthus tricolor TaxID=29722 RepID=UPI002589907B|nr:DNA repair protein recA homolog 3, mitochondrial isoform X2 [Amaranthus tricolor]
MAKLLRHASSLRRTLFPPESFKKEILGMSSQCREFSSKGRRKSKSDGSDSNEEGLSKKELALQQALDQISASFGKGTIMWLGRSITPRNVPVVSTGSFALDVALGIGGLPKGRVVEIFGPEASGKTTLSLHVIAEAQKLGGYCAFIDAEHALDPALAEAIGVAALVPKGELDGDMGDAHVAMQARLMSQALRKLSHSLSQSQSILLFLNQVRAKISTFGFGGPTEVTCGGNALKFYASVRLNIRRTAFVKKGEETIGSQVLVKVIKNKHAPPFKNAEFELEFGKGISRAAELISLGVKHKLIEKNGGHYRFNGQTVHGKDALKKYLSENVSAAEELASTLREKLLHSAEEVAEAEEDALLPDPTDEDVGTAAEA